VLQGSRMQSIPEHLEDEVLAALGQPLDARTTMLLEGNRLEHTVPPRGRKRVTWHNLQECAHVARITADVFGTVTATGQTTRFFKTGCGYTPGYDGYYRRMFDFRWDMQLASRQMNMSMRTAGVPWGLGSSIFQSSPTGEFWELTTPLVVVQGDSLSFEMEPTCWLPLGGAETADFFDTVTTVFTLHGWREKA